MTELVRVEGALASGYAPNPRAVAPPNLDQSPSVSIEQWDAQCSSEGCGSQLVSACFRASAGTWSAEVDELVQGKLADVAANTAFRVRGGDSGLHVVKQSPGERTLEGDGLAARSFVVFTSGGAVHGCFVLCVGLSGKAAPCASSVDQARIAGPIVAAPETSAGLGAVIAMVHHPSETFVGFVGFVCALGVLAIVLRPRARRRAARARYSEK